MPQLLQMDSRDSLPHTHGAVAGPEVDAQCDKLLSVVDRTSTVANTVNFLATSVVQVERSVWPVFVHVMLCPDAKIFLTK